MPDKKYAEKSIRFMRHWKSVLHGKFISKTQPLNVIIAPFVETFSRILDPTTKVPVCVRICENHSLKVEALKIENVGQYLCDVEATIRKARGIH